MMSLREADCEMKERINNVGSLPDETFVELHYSLAESVIDFEGYTKVRSSQQSESVPSLLKVIQAVLGKPSCLCCWCGGS